MAYRCIHMPFITFIYRIHTDIFYGKYICERMSDDHEGLDRAIYSTLRNGIRNWREQNNMPPLQDKIRLGVMSYSFEYAVPVYSSDKEIHCFDFYYTEHDNKYETYVNGELISNTFRAN